MDVRWKAVSRMGSIIFEIVFLLFWCALIGSCGSVQSKVLCQASLLRSRPANSCYKLRMMRIFLTVRFTPNFMPCLIMFVRRTPTFTDQPAAMLSNNSLNMRGAKRWTWGFQPTYWRICERTETHKHKGNCSMRLERYSRHTVNNVYCRRKFRSETSDNMDSWKAEVGRVRREKIRREKIRRERVRRKKMQMREKVGKSRNTVFFKWFVAPEGRQVGSLKRRVRSQLARWEMKICTPLWREAHFEVKI